LAILRNAEKEPLFSLAERRRMLEELTAPFKNVRVDIFEGLTVEEALEFLMRYPLNMDIDFI